MQGTGRGQAEKGLCDRPRRWILSSGVGQRAVKGVQSGQDRSINMLEESLWSQSGEGAAWRLTGQFRECVGSHGKE